MTKHLPKTTGRLVCAAMGICLLYYQQARAQNTHFNVSSGTYVKQATGGSLVFYNTDVATNGTLNASAGTVTFSGGSNSIIEGSAAPLINNLVLNKPAAKLTLNRNITVANLLTFSNGTLELNNKTLTLAEGAMLQNEDETNRITGATGGRVVTTATGVNNPAQLNAGNLGAAVTSAANLGDITITRMHKYIQNPHDAAKQSIQRTYLIAPQNNTSLNATLRFYYFDAELNGNNENLLTLWKSGDGVAWEPAGVTSRSTTDNYVEKTGLAKLGYYTLTDNNNALPISLISFRTTCQDKYALVEWQTGLEINAAYFEVERSADAVNWQTLQRVNATGAVNGASYNYHDVTPQATAFYRLKMVDKSGSFSYSSVFSGGCADIAMPFTIYPNPAVSHATASISVRQATKSTVQIFSQQGRQLYNTTWQLQPGNNQLVLPVAQLAAGAYLVKVLVNNTILKTQLIKQ